MLKYKYTEAIFTTSTRKQLWFEITKMLNAVYCVIYYTVSSKNVHLLFFNNSVKINRF